MCVYVYNDKICVVYQDESIMDKTNVQYAQKKCRNEMM